MQYIKFNSEEVRTVQFLDQEPPFGPPEGQQMVGWLPAGTYQVLGQETIKVSDRGNVQEAEVIRLLKPSKDGVRDRVYYVTVNQMPEGFSLGTP